MGEVFLRSEPAGVEEDRAELEGGIVSDAELPIRRKVAHGVLQIAVHDGKQRRNLRRRGLVELKPTVCRPPNSGCLLNEGFFPSPRREGGRESGFATDEQHRNREKGPFSEESSPRSG